MTWSGTARRGGAGWRRLLPASVLAAAAALVVFQFFGTGQFAPGQGRQLYLDNCASCHGAELEGQPGWERPLASGRLPAPPHDASGHTWHHPDSVLFTITRDGPAAIAGSGYESDMPAFADTLSDDEIREIIDYIKTTWPERERAYQADRTRADAGAGG